MSLARLRFMLIPALLVLLLAYQCMFAVRVMISDGLNFSVQRVMAYWGVEGSKPAASDVGAAQQTVEQALWLWPRHPDYLSLQARLQVWQGQIAPSKQAANAQFKLAIATMHQSLVERPGNPYSWAQYAEYLATQRDKRIELFSAVEKVKSLGAGDPALQKRAQALLGN